jgi:hypothetical protein
MTSESTIRNPYAGALKVTAWIAAGALVLALSALFLGGAMGQKDVALFGMAAGMIVLVCSLMMLAIFWFAGWMEKRGIRALLEGERWAHWRYGEEEWSRFTADEWARDVARARRVPFTALGSMGVAGLFVGWTRGDWLPGLALGLGAGVPLGLLVGAIAYGLARATHRRRQVAPGEAFIGPRGVFQDGRYTDWGGMSGSLGGVKLVPPSGTAPTVVEFTVRGRRGASGTVRVLVPAGKEAEAAALVARFSGS